MAPHSPVSPDRQIRLGDKDLTLRFSLRATMALQDLWKLKNEEEVQERLKKPENQMSDFIDLLWASTRSHHPELSREEVLNLADASGLEGLGQAATEAIASAMPPRSAGGGGSGPRKPAGKRTR